VSDKTEKPTPKKLKDAKQKGQVAKSKEVPSATVLVSVLFFLWAMFPKYLEEFKELMLLPTHFYTQPFESALGAVLQGVFYKVLILSLPVVFIAMIIGIFANLFQVGVMFSFESIKPSLNKLNPAEGIKKIFSMDNLMEFFKSIIKILFLGYLLYKLIMENLDNVIKIPYLGLPGILLIFGVIMKDLVINTATAFIIIAAIDYFWQKKRHTKKLMMSKDEVKQEYKEMEGDPIIKSKRKQLHREMAMNDTVQKTRKATVVVTNPQHLAIALYYDKDKTPLPVVVSKGEDLLARRIIEVAKEEGIPIMQNVPLAHSLYEQVAVDKFIPSDLIEPVAEVLKWVQSLNKA